MLLSNIWKNLYTATPPVLFYDCPPKATPSRESGIVAQTFRIISFIFLSALRSYCAYLSLQPSLNYAKLFVGGSNYFSRQGITQGDPLEKPLCGLALLLPKKLGDTLVAASLSTCWRDSVQGLTGPHHYTSYPTWHSDRHIWKQD